MNDKREIFGWSMYDWANSAFSTTVVTVFLGPYLTALVEAQVGEGGSFFLLGFIEIAAEAYFPFLVSTSVFLQVLILPLLGAIADYSNLKRRMWTSFAIIGAAVTIGMFFIEGDAYLFGGLLFIIANVAFGASIVFYNSFLPQIASPERRDSVSSYGWALGYLGGGVLLAINVALFSFAETLGISDGLAIRISLASAGVWWLVFGLFAIRRVRERGAERERPAGQSFLRVGIKQLRSTLGEMRKYPTTLRYLLAYLIYNDGIQTVIAISALFGAQELGMAISELTLLILMVQFVAFGGALLFGRIAGRVGAKQAIIITLIIWSGISIWAQLGLNSKTEFWILGAVVAVVLGGSQAISRSLFSQMIPKNQEAEFFSFYEISERGTSWTGPLLFGLVTQATGSMRTALFSLIVLFVGGLLLLITVDVERAIRESGNEVESDSEQLTAAQA